MIPMNVPMNVSKKISVAGIAFLVSVPLLTNLTACGSGAAADMPGEISDDAPDGISDDIPDDMPDDIPGETTVSIPETYEEYAALAADCYRQKDWENALAFYVRAKELDENREEIYRGMSDVYLQTDNVMQALAILDEGMANCKDKNSVDSISQRKEYILAGTVAVKIKRTENQYDADENLLSSSIWERDSSGNTLKFGRYGADGEIRNVSEYTYDENGNKTEYAYVYYMMNGDAYSSHETWSYDENGNEIEYIEYDDMENVIKRTERTYDENGNQITSVEYEYDKNGSIIKQTETEYDADGNTINIKRQEGGYPGVRKSTSEIKITYDENGRETKYEEYNEERRVEKKIIRDYDENGRQTKYVRYDAAGNTIEKWECTYDDNGNEMKYVHYDGAVTIDYWREAEYDERGNETRFARYSGDGSLEYMRKTTYDENERKIKSIYDYNGDDSISYMWEMTYDGPDKKSGKEVSVSYNDDGSISHMWETEYDADGNKRKVISTRYDGETGKQAYQAIYEYTYDEYKNMTKYSDTEYEEGRKTYSRIWEREYNKDGRETAFSFYDNEQTASYHSITEYNENGLAINYTGCDKKGEILIRKETAYDALGNVLRENYYDADGNLTQYYENAYDDFGSVIRQAVYENGSLQAGIQNSYAYRYIGEIDEEPADERDVFTRFLAGQEKIRYDNGGNSIEEGMLVEETITDFIDMEDLKYTFLDMTGDGIEELIISTGCKIYVIQYSGGVLKVIQDAVGGNFGAYLVKYNGSMGVCCDFGGHVGGNEQNYYFFDGKGKKLINLGDYQDFLEDGTESRSYSMSDNDSFEWRDISIGEYYDIDGAIVTDMEIDWQQLEESCYGNG